MSAIFTKWFPSGFRLINGQSLINWFNNPQVSTDDGITATAGGTQAAAYQLSAAINHVSVCATNADSVKLPDSTKNVGAVIYINNDGAANLQVFTKDAGTIDGIDGVATGVVLTAARRGTFMCSKSGVWESSFSLKSA